MVMERAISFLSDPITLCNCVYVVIGISFNKICLNQRFSHGTAAGMWPVDGSFEHCFQTCRNALK